jgi:CBS domain containing-hemolysin-like protein
LRLDAFKRLKKTLVTSLLKRGLRKAELSEEEIKFVIEAGTKSGVLDKTEHDLIKSILEFSDITAKEVMVPRPDVVALDMNMPREVLMRRVIDEGYSRLPVFAKTIDNIVGIVYSKDLLSLLEHRDLIILQDILRPAFFVPESKKISELLREFQQNKVHLAIVIDEHGGTEGIITIEDIIEEIVGEIFDEYDETTRSVIQSIDGSSIVNATISIHDFNEQFVAQLPETPDYETLAGYLQQVTGRLPELHEEIRQSEFVFTIAAKRGRRIKYVKVVRLQPSAQASAIEQE